VAVLSDGRASTKPGDRGRQHGFTVQGEAVLYTISCPFKLSVCDCVPGHPYVGVDFTRGICGVSIIRSGEAMETALRECCQGVKVGKILVHRCVCVYVMRMRGL
jgi:hypothetical protein